MLHRTQHGQQLLDLSQEFPMTFKAVKLHFSNAMNNSTSTAVSSSASEPRALLGTDNNSLDQRQNGTKSQTDAQYKSNQQMVSKGRQEGCVTKCSLSFYYIFIPKLLNLIIFLLLKVALSRYKLL